MSRSPKNKKLQTRFGSAKYVHVRQSRIRTPEITMDSRLRDVCTHPVGHDACKKILMSYGQDEGLICNPVIGNLRLRTASRLFKKMLGEDFFPTLLALLNSEPDDPDMSPCEIQKKWWKEAVFYQIYPRSFHDGDGDGTGDISGILGKLDYLKNLGVDALWLSPIYDSPNDDNGYDIRDYYTILKEFGTMEDFALLLSGIHKRGMRLIMDLVVNHTSDEHPWFKEALNDPDSPYHNYYFLRPGSGDQPPNNWTSFFSGSAWNYYEDLKEWGLHLFSRKQMDLNWDNPAVRRDIINMIRFWLHKGVDGFRLDVINYISKDNGLPDGNEQIGELLSYYGIEHYFYGPRLHEYLRQIRAEAFEPYGAFTVGETPGVGMEMSKLLTGEDRGELDMVFSFDHLETPGHARFDDYKYDLNYLKNYYIEWMTQYGNRCWMSLFYDNHDNPRMLAKVGPERMNEPVLAKLLGMVQMTLKGTPFIYQGQEIGCGNEDFRDISELHDVESLNLYRELIAEKGMDEKAAFKKILCGTRDHARAMMKWDEVSRQKQEHDSVYFFYKKLIALRKKNPVLIYGALKFVCEKRKNILAYYRKDGADQYYIVCNLSEKRIRRPRKPGGYRGILSNYAKHSPNWMEPYEACLYRR